MRIFLTILATPVLLLASCSEPTSVETDAQPNRQGQWQATNVDPAAAQRLIAETPHISILDIRTPGEYAEGHIDGAINIDFKASDFAQKVAQLDKDKPYILHCRSGNRSTNSLPVFKDNKFGTIYHLDKGFNAWKAANMPVAR